MSRRGGKASNPASKSTKDTSKATPSFGKKQTYNYPPVAPQDDEDDEEYEDVTEEEEAPKTKQTRSSAAANKAKSKSSAARRGASDESEEEEEDDSDEEWRQKTEKFRQIEAERKREQERAQQKQQEQASASNQRPQSSPNQARVSTPQSVTNSTQSTRKLLPNASEADDDEDEEADEEDQGGEDPEVAAKADRIMSNIIEMKAKKGGGNPGSSPNAATASSSKGKVGKSSGSEDVVIDIDTDITADKATKPKSKSWFANKKPSQPETKQPEKPNDKPATKTDSEQKSNPSAPASAGASAASSAAKGTPPKKTHWELVKMTIPFLWPDGNLLIKFYVVLSAILLVAGKLFELAVPIYLAQTIDSVSQVENGTKAREMSSIALPIILYGVFYLAKTVCGELKNLAFAPVSSYAERSIALSVFNHLQSLSLRYHLNRKTGAVIRSISRGSQSFGTVANIILFQIVPIFIQVVVVCAYLFARYPWYFAIITFATILSYFIFTFTSTEWRNKFRRTMNDKDNEYNQKAVDALLNFETVKYFNAETHEEKRFDKALIEYQRASVISNQTLAVLNAGQGAIIAFGVFLAMMLSGKLVVDGDMSVGDFVLINQFILTLYAPLGFLGTYYRMFKQTLVDVESMFAILNEEPEIEDDEAAEVLRPNGGEIKFDHVSFKYNPEDPPILNDISFTVKPGQKVAIVGKSGVGKSTLARLIYRFYNIQGGAIFVDGQDVSKVTQRSLRSAIAIVPQDCVLFNDTIGYNINYGRAGIADLDENPAASASDVQEAAKLASLHDFIETQKDKYETQVGERGLRLSGGEKQRVAIARAMLKRPEILIFDEATSSLDTHTEREIQKSLDYVSRGRTTLIIAHRLSTIADCDMIIVLKDGKIAEKGNHQDLFSKGGEYYGMWMRQQQSAQLEKELQAIQAWDKAKALAGAAPAGPASAAASVPPFLSSAPAASAASQRSLVSSSIAMERQASLQQSTPKPRTEEKSAKKVVVLEEEEADNKTEDDEQDNEEEDEEEDEEEYEDVQAATQSPPASRQPPQANKSERKHHDSDEDNDSDSYLENDEESNEAKTAVRPGAQKAPSTRPPQQTSSRQPDSKRPPQSSSSRPVASARTVAAAVMSEEDRVAEARRRYLAGEDDDDLDAEEREEERRKQALFDGVDPDQDEDEDAFGVSDDEVQPTRRGAGSSAAEQGRKGKAEKKGPSPANRSGRGYADDQDIEVEDEDDYARVDYGSSRKPATKSPPNAAPDNEDNRSRSSQRSKQQPSSSPSSESSEKAKPSKPLSNLERAALEMERLAAEAPEPEAKTLSPEEEAARKKARQAGRTGAMPVVWSLFKRKSKTDNTTGTDSAAPTAKGSATVSSAYDDPYTDEAPQPSPSKASSKPSPAAAAKSSPLGREVPAIDPVKNKKKGKKQNEEPAQRGAGFAAFEARAAEEEETEADTAPAASGPESLRVPAHSLFAFQAQAAVRVRENPPTSKQLKKERQKQTQQERRRQEEQQREDERKKAELLAVAKPPTPTQGQGAGMLSNAKQLLGAVKQRLPGLPFRRQNSDEQEDEEEQP